jgi:acetamidase/formamidase
MFTLSSNTVDSVVPSFAIARGQEHYAFSRAIPPVIRVGDGAIVEVYINDASDDLVAPGMTVESYAQLTFPDPFGHPLLGPVYVKGAEPRDTLAVTLHKIVLKDWGWTDTDPHYAYLCEELDEVHLKTYVFDDERA